MSAPRTKSLLLTLAAGLALMGLFAPAASARPFVIEARGSQTGIGSVDAIGSFRPAPDPTLRGAIRAYGQPTSRAGGGEICRVRWADIGVRIRFQNFGGVDSCQPRRGRAQKALVSGDPRWRTDRGLRLGATVARARALYPAARRTRRGLRLVQAILPFGRPQPYAVLGARLRDGRIAAFTLFIGAAGD